MKLPNVTNKSQFHQLGVPTQVVSQEVQGHSKRIVACKAQEEDDGRNSKSTLKEYKWADDLQELDRAFRVS